MIVCEGERCRVEGALTMANVTAVLEESRRAFQLRLAVADKRAIEYTNLPANLRTLADLYGVSELIPAA
jgi:hypothetical protein